VSSVVTRIAAG